VTAGIKWFSFLVKRDLNMVIAKHVVIAINTNWVRSPFSFLLQDPIQAFHEFVPKYFKSKLKPPFNKAAREAAGMTEEWYMPLAKPINKAKK
jgi:uncharacterized ferritin-like protein (DUF455 family)